MLYRFFNGSVRCVGRKKVDLCSARALRSLRLLDAECNDKPEYTQECRSDQSIAEPGNDSVCRSCRTRGPDWHRVKSGGHGPENRETGLQCGITQYLLHVDCQDEAESSAR